MKTKTKRKCARIILIVLGLLFVGIIAALVIGNTNNKNINKTEETEIVSKAKPLVIEIKPKNEEEPESSSTPKFQDKYSMDWSFMDEGFLIKIASYKGKDKSVEERAYIILVTLNRVFSDQYPNDITQVVLDELYGVDGLTPYYFEEIPMDEESYEALDMIMYEKFDNSNGSLDYNNFLQE